MQHDNSDLSNSSSQFDLAKLLEKYENKYKLITIPKSEWKDLKDGDHIKYKLLDNSKYENFAYVIGTILYVSYDGNETTTAEITLIESQSVIVLDLSRIEALYKIIDVDDNDSLDYCSALEYSSLIMAKKFKTLELQVQMLQAELTQITKILSKSINKKKSMNEIIKEKISKIIGRRPSN
jgi:hypothetical protein